MKKLLATILALTMTMSLVACTNSDSEDEDTASKREIASVDKSSTDDDNNKDDTDSKDNNADDDSESKDTTDGSLDVSFTVDEQVIWETEDVKLSITGIESDSFWGTEINVLAESKSDKDVTITTDNIIINNYMIDGLFYVELTAGNKATDSIVLYESELEAAGIDNIGQIELYLYTYDPDTYETIDRSDCITIKTSEFDNMDTTSNIEGVTILDQDGIKIVGQYVDENSFWGQAVVVYIENNTDKNIIVDCDDVAVNGFMIDGFMYQEVFAGKKAFTDITFFESDLDDNGITSIQTIEASFDVIDDDYNDVASSGKVTITLK